MQWGMVGFEDKETTRPAFTGEKAQSPVDGKPMLHFSKYERLRRSMRTGSAICGFLCVVIGTVAIIFVIRTVMATNGESRFGVGSTSTSASIITVSFPSTTHSHAKKEEKKNNFKDFLCAHAYLFILQFDSSCLFLTVHRPTSFPVC